MANRVCVLANSLASPERGGQVWVYLNWALGLRQAGCDVTWLETIEPGIDADTVRSNLPVLREGLRPYGFADRIALCSPAGEASEEARQGCLSLEAAAESAMLANIAYNSVGPEVVRRFRRSALVDIDPGLTQIWIDEGQMPVAPHDVYFTIGETIGRPPIPDCGLRWHYTPPPVALDYWPVHPSEPGAPFTTITHWGGAGIRFGGQDYRNGKRDGFLPFLEVPRRTGQPLELAVHMEEKYQPERVKLQASGWRLQDPYSIAATPSDYQRYIRNSAGEFSCVKPSCLLFQNAWISDRTICYLASGKPAVVQYTGSSAFLPDRSGLFRFRTPEEAVDCLETAAKDYRRQSRLARQLAEEHFDAAKVARRVLEIALN